MKIILTASRRRRHPGKGAFLALLREGGRRELVDRRRTGANTVGFVLEAAPGDVVEGRGWLWTEEGGGYWCTVPKEFLIPPQTKQSWPPAALPPT